MALAVTIVDAVDVAAWEATGQRVKKISRDIVAEVLNAHVSRSGE